MKSDGRHVRVIEIQCMAGDSVDQCRVGGAQPVPRSQHPRLLMPTEQQGLFPGDPCRGLLGARDGETDMVEQATGVFCRTSPGMSVASVRATDEVEQSAGFDGSPVIVGQNVRCMYSV